MMTGALYNDTDPYCAQWLRNLIAAGHITRGDVDERDIRDLAVDDVAGYHRCHFFAGIAGWDHALALAGWPAALPIWTGSCPCQPLSGAGQRKGHVDERHLWPAFYRLIAECRPTTIFGEQVASKDGREWLAGVRADLEGIGYACGAADLPACSIGAPHKRQRLFWLAYSDCERIGYERGGLRSVQLPGGLQSPPAWSKGTSESPLLALDDGLPGDVGRLRAYGNAIVPQAAAQFIAAFMQTQREAAA